MKKVIGSFMGIFFSILAHAQTLNFASSIESPIPDSLFISLPKTDSTHKFCTLYFKISKLSKGQTVKVTMNDNNKGTAEYNTDYKYQNELTKDTITITDISSDVFYVNIYTITTKSTTGVLNINLNSKGKIDKTYKIIFTLNTRVVLPNPVMPLLMPDTSKWYLRVVTGGNFDFFNGPSIKDFAGDITLFVPNTFKVKGASIGFELGMNNYHYFNSDSSHRVSQGQSYFLNPKDYYNSNDTSKVVRTTQNLNRKYDYNTWGIHIGALVQLLSNEFAQLYGKLQIEELATTETYTPTITSSVNDTISYDLYKQVFNTGILKNSSGASTPPYPSAHPIMTYKYSQHTYYDTYFGGGLSGTINIKNAAKFCYSITGGCANIEKADPSFDLDPIQRDLIRADGSLHEKKFYTVNKFQLITSIAPVDLAVGGEYRTVAGKLHYFTTYIGAVVTIDKLKK